MERKLFIKQRAQIVCLNYAMKLIEDQKWERQKQLGSNRHMQDSDDKEGILHQLSNSNNSNVTSDDSNKCHDFDEFVRHLVQVVSSDLNRHNSNKNSV